MSKDSQKKSKQELVHELSNAMRYSQNLSDAFDEIVCKALGLNLTELRLIDVLDQNGPQTAGNLAHLARVSPATVTGSIDRLEKKGYVERGSDPDDRRKSVIKTTAAVWKDMSPFYDPLYQ